MTLAINPAIGCHYCSWTTHHHGHHCKYSSYCQLCEWLGYITAEQLSVEPANCQHCTLSCSTPTTIWQWQYSHTKCESATCKGVVTLYTTTSSDLNDDIPVNARLNYVTLAFTVWFPQFILYCCINDLEFSPFLQLFISNPGFILKHLQTDLFQSAFNNTHQLTQHVWLIYAWIITALCKCFLSPTYSSRKAMTIQLKWRHNSKFFNQVQHSYIMIIHLVNLTDLEIYTK